MNRSAIFSSDRTQRFVLTRVWDTALPLVAFIGLNPSTANETQDDNTIKKCIKIARNNGFGGFKMLNTMSVVTAYPAELHTKFSDHERNRLFIEDEIKECKSVVFCWGNFKEAQWAMTWLTLVAPDALCLKRNKNGSPKHPLYCHDNSELIPFYQQETNS